MNVAYLGPLKDYSGYGEANRHAAAALDAAGINVIAKLVSYSQESADFGALGVTIDRLIANDNNRQDYQIKILHTTPDQYPRYMEKGKYHIGHFFWETDSVPPDFCEGLKLMDEIWTGSEANHAALIKSGIKNKIRVFPQAIETDRDWPEPYLIPDFSPEDTLFYSIFEWTDRKNPAALLEAYWREFEGQEDVGLLIKTYFRNFTLANRRMIKSQIDILKAKIGIKKTPPVFLYMDLMDRQQIMRLHRTGHVYVSAHRGEGWGIPQAEAALAGNLVISTGYGGISEYFDKEEAKILPYEMVPLRGMTHSTQWYDNSQNWAEVDENALREAMRWAYENPALAGGMAQNGQAMVEKNFNLKTVGEAMANRLKEIEGEL